MHVLIASFVGHAGNYIFYIVAARMITPAQFAALSALIAFGTIAMMPINGVQLAVARDVALLRATGRHAALSGYLRRLGARMGALSVGLLAVIAAASPLLGAALHIGSPGPVVLAGVWIGFLAVLGVLTGVTQGLERFCCVAFSLAIPLGALRPVVLPVCLLLAGLAGGMVAMLVATLVGVLVLGCWVIGPARVAPAPPPAMPSTVVTMTALLAFSSLTNIDLLVAQTTLAESDRAHYASAVLLGKIAFFAPAALALVLLPKATATLERGERAERAVLATMAVTTTCGLLVAAVLWVLPTWVLAGTFGPAYAAAKPLLAPLALVMTAAAVLWVHLTFATARRSRAMSAGLVVAAVGHWALLSLLHGSPAQIITASAIAIGTSVVVIELVSDSGVLRMARRRTEILVSHVQPRTFANEE